MHPAAQGCHHRRTVSANGRRCTEPSASAIVAAVAWPSGSLAGVVTSSGTAAGCTGYSLQGTRRKWLKETQLNEGGTYMLKHTHKNTHNTHTPGLFCTTTWYGGRGGRTPGSETSTNTVSHKAPCRRIHLLPDWFSGESIRCHKAADWLILALITIKLRCHMTSYRPNAAPIRYHCYEQHDLARAAFHKSRFYCKHWATKAEFRCNSLRKMTKKTCAAHREPMSKPVSASGKAYTVRAKPKMADPGMCLQLTWDRRKQHGGPPAPMVQSHEPQPGSESIFRSVQESWNNSLPCLADPLPRRVVGGRDWGWLRPLAVITGRGCMMERLQDGGELGTEPIDELWLCASVETWPESVSVGRVLLPTLFVGLVDAVEAASEPAAMETD